MEVRRAPNELGEPEIRTIVCRSCGTEQDVTDIIEGVASRVDDFRSEERQFMFGSVAIFLVFTLLSVLTGNHLTFVGGAVWSLLMLVKALGARYRVWQIVHDKVLMDRPQIGTWLRYEFGGNGK